MASEQASRAATMAPAALAYLRIVRDGPAAQQAMAQRAAEGVPGPDAVDHLHRDRRHLADPGGVLGQHAARALLDHGQVHAEVAQRLGRPVRLALGHRGVALVQVAHRHGHVRQRGLHLPPGLRA